MRDIEDEIMRGALGLGWNGTARQVSALLFSASKINKRLFQ